MDYKSSNHFLGDNKRSKIIKVTQDDHTYPESFDELLQNPDVLRSVFESCGGCCNRLQSITIKLINTLPHRNLLAQALSGSGKEVAYITSIYERLADSNLRSPKIPQAIVICPTPELAKKIKKIALDVGWYLKWGSVKIATDDNDENITDCDILIGVPSILKNVFQSKNVDFSDVKMVILEELDFILKEDEMEADVSWILKSIKRVQALSQIVIFYSSITDKLRLFVPEIVPQYNLNMMYCNEEEYSVFNTELFKFPVVDENDKILAVIHLLEILGKDEKVVIYKNKKRDVSYLIRRLEAGGNSVFASGFKVVGSYNVLITSYPVPSHDQFKVIATIFLDIPDGNDNGNELYYRLATRVGPYCEQGIGGVLSGSVFHLVSPSDADRMNRIENYFGRRVKELASVTSYDGFVGLVDVLLEADVIDATLAATLRRGAKDRRLGPLYSSKTDFSYGQWYEDDYENVVFCPPYGQRDDEDEMQLIWYKWFKEIRMVNSSNNFLDSVRYPPRIIASTNDTCEYPHSYEELHLPDHIIQILTDKFKLRAPDRLQALALPMIIRNPRRHLMAQACSGSGIRLCFVLAMLERLDFGLGCIPQVLVVCPSQDAVSEMYSLTLAAGKQCKDLKVVQIVDISTYDEGAAHIFIGLPKYISRLCRRLDFTDIKMMILDNTDYMIQNDSHKNDIAAIIKGMTPRQPQNFVIQQQYKNETKHQDKKIKTKRNVYQVLLSYASLTDNLRSFVHKILPPYANELLFLPQLGYDKKNLDSLPQGHMDFLFVNEEELSVFTSKLLKFPVSDDEKDSLVLKIMKARSADKQVVIYVDRTTDVSLLKQRIQSEFDTDIVVVQPRSLKLKKVESDSLLSFRLHKTRVLITSAPISPPGCFDNSEVSLVIFYDLPMILAGPDYELYYRIVTCAGRNCKEGLVFHLVNQNQNWVMTSYETHFGRCAYWLNDYGLEEVCKAVPGSLRNTVERHSTKERKQEFGRKKEFSL